MSGDTDTFEGQTVEDAMRKAVAGNVVIGDGTFELRDYQLQRFIRIYTSLVDAGADLPEPRKIFYDYLLSGQDPKSISDFLEWFQRDYETTYLWR